jgi:quercetin dioxygenase-like cupin family protein
MKKYALAAAAFFVISAAVGAQDLPVVGDRTTPLRALGGEGNVGVSNAVLRDQPEVRALRVVVEPNGVRAMHTHDDVDFHLFTPISGPMELVLANGATVTVQPLHPYFMDAGTEHGFRNHGAAAVEIMEIFVR